ncbi:helix-turn-helix transcriptional regulator [Gleimia hominis]|uniref:HTH domain-containing protein n=1 Tax=Gleimia hominis TaxID=595468 RepID=A0ABU3ICG8_9ACTO|nr:HTH domain-containing protein [Gleimia hominis]MDT3768068.1 HTH domain-containing protein [Gleimia hominis]WIK65262.1 HTH domain-containing protein [Gleimia hominis]
MAPSEEPQGTREQVLDLVVEKGPVTSTVIARILGLTTAAVRRHITSLEAAGEIEEHEIVSTKPRGRGRPARHYVATEAAHDQLTDSYSEIANRALSYLAQTAGEGAIESFAAARSREIERKYAPIIRAAGNDPRAQAMALADALTQDGYAASVRDVGAGNFAVQLCQGHCPILTVAEEFPQLCEAETQAFARLLDVHVQRLATLTGGEHVCTTHIPVASITKRPRWNNS